MRTDARRWFDQRTSLAADWPVEPLQRAKGATKVSVVVPALDEEPTVGTVVAGVRALAEETGLVDQIVVMDSGSVDRTAAAARAAGATVHHRDDVLPSVGSRPGKGEVLWKALAVTSGDVVVYVDADLLSFGPHYLTGLLGPLLHDGDVHMVKAFYDRPLLDVSAGGGGRVTELMARPLLNALAPELAGVVQPLAGEYAARRWLLERLPFASGYGVEVGLLLDAVRLLGLDAIAQVDLGHRVHGHQDTAALGRMASSVLLTVLDRLAPEVSPATQLTQFHRVGGRVRAADAVIPLADRPPMVDVPEYTRMRVS